jgi:hypothetical protein
VIDTGVPTFTNSTGSCGVEAGVCDTSTVTYQVVDPGVPTFTNSTGTYQVLKKLTDEGTWLWHMNTLVFTNSTGTYMQTPSGTYLIYQ